MTAQTLPAELTEAIQTLPYRFTVEQYDGMGETGIIPPDTRVELMKGEILQMSPIGIKHAWLVRVLNALLSVQLGERGILDVQNPIVILPDSEPEPDLAILRPRADFYKTAHPQPTDVILVVEVSDTTLSYDKRIKAPVYAHALIPEMWLFDVNAEIALHYSEPKDGAFQSVVEVKRGGTLTIHALPGVTISVSELFG